MGYLADEFSASTEELTDEITSNKIVKGTFDTVNAVGGGVMDALTIAGRAVLLTLSTGWLATSLFNPATTRKKPFTSETQTAFEYGATHKLNEEIRTEELNRFDTVPLWGLKLGDFFMPLSQTFSVSASKKINVSSLVDGVDIIQQTRKEAKTVDCVLKISVNENQKNLQILDSKVTSPDENIAPLIDVLEALYESSQVFAIENYTLNEAFDVWNVIMTKYKFTPKAGSRVFVLEFSLTEVSYFENILTFDERQASPQPTTTSPTGL